MQEARIDTHFAPAARTAPDELGRRLRVLAENPVTDTLLRTAGGLLAILDANRQILAVNDAFVRALGVGDAEQVLGLRPGEAIACVHAHEPPHGCGTTPHCMTCGAAIAIVTALADGGTHERLCVAEVCRDGRPDDLVLKVRACPIDLGGESVVLLYLQDATDEQRLATLERVFHHDLGNILQGLTAAADLIGDEPDARERRVLAGQIVRLAAHMDRELRLQSTLRDGDPARLETERREVTAGAVLDELRRVLLHHPDAAARTLVVRPAPRGVDLRTDLWLLVRVLVNLVVNALEATEPGGRVEVAADAGTDAVVFHVRSPAAIPREIRPRIFQKHFSTKPGRGHGLGTWSARLFAERLLGGEVGFTSGDRDGTDFTVTVPR